jgi:hypothetical protein
VKKGVHAREHQLHPLNIANTKHHCVLAINNSALPEKANVEVTGAARLYRAASGGMMGWAKRRYPVTD